MNLVKRKDIHWDVVKKASWPAKLGWPITMYKSGWGAGSEEKRFRFEKTDDGITQLRIKLFKKIDGVQLISINPTVTEPASLRPELIFRWNGWLWFWKAS